MKKNKEDITGIPKKNIDSLHEYLTVYKIVNKNQKSFRLTSQLLTTVYKKANRLQKKGLIVLTIPTESSYNFRVECIINKEKK